MSRRRKRQISLSLEGCPFVCPDWKHPKALQKGEKKRCRGCGRVLPRRKHVWCDTKGADGLVCVQRWERNHVWSVARWWAVKQQHVKVETKNGWRTRVRCEGCGGHFPDVAHLIEVHHRTPLSSLLPHPVHGYLMDPYGQGCQHHQEGLIVLCNRPGGCHGTAHGIRPVALPKPKEVQASLLTRQMELEEAAF